MPFPIAVAAIGKALLANGLGVLGNAVMTKGFDWVEEKTGVKIPRNAEGLTEEKLVELKKAEMTHEEVLVNASLKEKELEIEHDKHAQTQVSERWRYDMASDDKLSKRIRPLTLLFILIVYTLFALMSAFGINVTAAYVELLGQWGMLIMSAYFAGRSAEKIVSVVQRYKALKGQKDELGK